MVGKRIRVTNDLADYEKRGYKDNPKGYVVTKEENYGVFIKEYGYIILHGDFEVID